MFIQEKVRHLFSRKVAKSVERSTKSSRKRKKRQLLFQHCEKRQLFAALAEAILPAGDFDAVAVRSGSWTSPSTWRGGIVPTNGHNVRINGNANVTVNGEIPGSFNFINVRGTLQFRNNVDTLLRTETLHIDQTGLLQVGTARAPIQADNTAEIVFRSVVRSETDRADGFDRRDRTRIGLGLLVEPTGRVEAHGQEKAGTVTSNITTPANRRSFAANSDRLSVIGNLSQWRVGDEISIAATQFNRGQQQTETAVVRGIVRTPGTSRRDAFDILLGTPGRRNTPYNLEFNHRNFAGEVTHVVNQTRNVIFRSQTDFQRNELNPARGQLERRGHIMSHSQRVALRNVEFENLGRTDKTLVVEDAIDGAFARDRQGEIVRVPTPGNSQGFVPGTRDGFVNQRGRYAVHFHRTLDVRNDDGDFIYGANNVAVVTGSVVNGSPGWGFVSHSSGVNFTNNVAVGVDGAAFVAESGNEIGLWRNNVALDGAGNGSFATRRVEESIFPPGEEPSGDFFRRLGEAIGETGLTSPDFSVRHGDFAREGVGFWIQSPGIRVINNVAAGMQGRGFVIYNQGQFETDRGEEAGFRRDLITWGDNDYLTWNQRGQVNFRRAIVQTLTFNEFRGNTSYASFIGLQNRFQQSFNREFAIDWGSPGFVGSRNINADGSVFEDFTSLRNEIGVTTSYSDDSRYEDLRVVHDVDQDGYAVLAQQSIREGITFENLDIEGYSGGIDARSVAFSITLINPNFDLVGDAEQVQVLTGPFERRTSRIIDLDDFTRLRNGTFRFIV